MKKKKKIILIKSLFFNLLIVILFFISSFKVYSVESLTSTSRSVVLMEINSGRILLEKNKDEIHLTASICKIMTAIVAIENGNLNDYYKVDNDTINQVGSSIYLQKDDQIKLIDLLYGMMLRSGNDAAYLIAKNVFNSYDKFIMEMNNKAKELKMISSSFANPTGLDEETKNYSTANDMAILMSYAMKNKTFRKIVGTKNYSCRTKNDISYYFNNKHRLVHQNEYVTGGKTGYTKLAKRTLVTTYKKNDLEICVVTFDCGNDWEVHNNLSEYAFNNYENVNIWKRGILDINDSLYQVTPIIYEDISYPIKKDEKLKCNIFLLKKPTSNDKIIGKIKLLLNDKVVKEISIYRYY